MALHFSYIGEPLSASGYALAGAHRYTPQLSAPAIVKALNAAREHSTLVLIETGYAALIQEYLQTTIAAQPLPPIVVVPSLHEEGTVSDQAVRAARTVLGIG